MKKSFLGLMFHHFHDNKRFLKNPGSLSADQFYKMIKSFGKKNFISPDEFSENCKNGNINTNQICITFDDGLRSQFEIAYPVMQSLNIQGFFFIPSSIFSKELNILETVRYFKENFYQTVDEYYEDFFIKLKDFKDLKIIESNLKKNHKQLIIIKKKFPFYSFEDVKYRFVRDYLISKEIFTKVNLFLFKKYKFNYKKINNIFFMSKNNLKVLTKEGNQVGLHSHSHPTKISNLSYKKQLYEYSKNKIILEKIINKKIFSMSHPCNKYNSDTLKILKKLNISTGFLASKNLNFNKKIKNSNFLIPREDAGNLI